MEIFAIVGGWGWNRHLGLHRQIESLTRRLQTTPDDLDLRLRRAEIYFRHEEEDLALGDLGYARRLSPAEPKIDHLLALIYAGRYHRLRSARQGVAPSQAESFAKRQAFDAAYRFLWCKRPHAEIAFLLARLHREEGDTEAAIRMYRESVEIQATPDRVLEFGRLYEDQRRWQEAERLYDQAFRTLSKAITLRIALLRVLEERGKWIEAIAWIDDLLPELPIQIEWRLHKARLLDRLHQADRARRERLFALLQAQESVRDRPSALNRQRLRLVQASLSVGVPPPPPRKGLGTP